MIDTKSENLMPVGQGRKHPLMRMKEGGFPSSTTYWRRITRGVCGPRGDRIKLETIILPSGRFTSTEAIERFVAALNGITVPSDSPSVAGRIDRAAEELAAVGIA